MPVPCGKCLDCLKRRQSDYAARIYRESQRWTSMHFITLTYKSSKLPISHRPYLVDSCSGEVVKLDDFRILDRDSEAYNTLVTAFKDIPSSNKPRYIVEDKEVFDGIVYHSEFTPSLNREDVRLWLKKSRIQYERDFDKKLHFSYAFCGEYGPRGCRPHYHMITFGLSDQEVLYLVNRWRNSFGFVQVKKVNAINKDGSDGRNIVAKYVGKYVSKGKFDCESVLSLDAQKGRLCNSLRLGTRFTSRELYYYRAYDLYGFYDIDTLQIETSSNYGFFHNYWRDGLLHPGQMSSSQLSDIVAEVRKRAHLAYVSKNLDGSSVEHSMPLPRSMKKYIYSVRDSYYDKEKNKYQVRYVSSVLSRKVADSIRTDNIAEASRKYQLLYPEGDISVFDSNALLAFLFQSRASESAKRLVLEENSFRSRYFQNQKDCQ